MARRDPNTLSNYDKIRTQHITANLNIDFAKKRLNGTVVLAMWSREEQGEIVLDTSYLDIRHVKVNGKDTKWSLDARNIYGNALRVPVNHAGGRIVVEVGVFASRDVSDVARSTRQRRRVVLHCSG